jgi:uncharacterized membrane protein YcjF (UPF0283 family)
VKLQDAVRLAKHASKHANVDNAKRFAQHVVPEVVRPARIIWNQAIGVLFFVLAIPAFLKAIQLYRAFQADPKSGFVALAISCVFVIVMVSFGASSFLRAHRIASHVHRP